jgi:hypothetical protein
MIVEIEIAYLLNTSQATPTSSACCLLVTADLSGMKPTCVSGSDVSLRRLHILMLWACSVIAV